METKCNLIEYLGYIGLDGFWCNYERFYIINIEK